MAAVISILCVIMGLWFCYKGIESYLNMRSMEKYGYQTTASIIEVIVEEDYDPETGTSYTHWPIYEYRDIYNDTHQVKPSSTTGLTTYELGDLVDIMYTPDDPEQEILVLTNAGKWKDVFGFIASGLLSFTIGVGVFVHNGIHEDFYLIG